jgi:protein-S-isoprenylcysteine O-methyltransferase Ste14
MSSGLVLMLLAGLAFVGARELLAWRERRESNGPSARATPWRAAARVLVPVGGLLLVSYAAAAAVLIDDDLVSGWQRTLVIALAVGLTALLIAVAGWLIGWYLMASRQGRRRV